MTRLRLGRYLAEAAALMGAAVALIHLLPADVLSSGQRFPASLGVLAAGFVEAVAYPVVGQAMIAHPDRVIGRWLLSVLGKLGFLFACAALALVLAGTSAKAFLVSMGVSFVILSLHQVLRLVQLSDALQEKEG